MIQEKNGREQAWDFNCVRSTLGKPLIPKMPFLLFKVLGILFLPHFDFGLGFERHAILVLQYKIPSSFMSTQPKGESKSNEFH